MRRNYWIMVCVVLSAAAMSVAMSANAGDIYNDSFTRSGVLNGSSPDVVNTGGATWTAVTGWNTDGANGTALTAADRTSVYLPFTPTAGKIYRLSVDLLVDESSNPNAWFTLGFSASNGAGQWVADAPSFYALNQNLHPLPASNLLRGVTDAGATWGDGGSGFPVPMTLTIILDTMPAAWTAEFRLNDTMVVTDTLGANPVITHVGLGVYDNRNIAVDNFRLTEVPFPATKDIYIDSFTRSDLVNGTTPDVENTGGATWSAKADWNTYGNGITAKRSSDSTWGNALLPFVPQAGMIYTFSLDLVSLTTLDSNQYGGLGFLTGNNLAASIVGEAGNSPLIYVRNTAIGGTDIASIPIAEAVWGGSTTVTLPETYSIVLSTTTAAWSAEFYAGSTSLGTHIYTANPTIAYVGCGLGAFQYLEVDNFRLTRFKPPSGTVVTVK